MNSLHPLERRIIPFLSKYKNFDDLVKISGMKDVEAMRAIQWLQNKKVLEIKEDVDQIIILGKNGRIYLKQGLPEKAPVLGRTGKAHAGDQ